MGEESEERQRWPTRAQFGSLATTASVVAGTFPGDPALSIASGALALLANYIDSSSRQDLAERLKRLEESEFSVQPVTGDRVKVLASAVEAATDDAHGWISAGKVIEQQNLAPGGFREAAEELEELGLLTVAPGGNSPSGIARIKLPPTAFLQVGSQLTENISVGDEFRHLLETVAECEDDRFANADDVLKRSGLPKPRFKMYVEAADELGLLDGQTDGPHLYQPYFWLEISGRGRRLLRGEEPLRAGEEFKVE